jgi:hypothetical protein
MEGHIMTELQKIEIKIDYAKRNIERLQRPEHQSPITEEFYRESLERYLARKEQILNSPQELYGSERLLGVVNP